MITNFFALSKNPELVEFRDYVFDFYGPESNLYPIEGLTLAKIEIAIVEFLKRCSDPADYREWGGGDSVDREWVRDIILEAN